MRKLFAVGDIHGCFEKLSALMDKINIDFQKDMLIFLGDYVDRGPASFEVVEYLIDLKKKHADNIIFLKGNHEELFLDYLDGKNRLVFLSNGGQKTIESYMSNHKNKDKNPVPKDHISFFQSLELFYATDDYIFVHAGLKKKVPLEEQVSEDLLWIRKKFIRSRYYFGKQVIFGHTPFPEPLVQSEKIGIDTGAVFGKKLTCVELPSLKFYSV